MTLQEYKEILKMDNLDDLSKLSPSQEAISNAARTLQRVFKIKDLKVLDICNTIYSKLHKEYKDVISHKDILKEYLKSIKINYSITNDVLEEYEKLIDDPDIKIKHLSINFNGLYISLSSYLETLEMVNIPKLSELIEGCIKDYLINMNYIGENTISLRPKVINASFEFID